MERYFFSWRIALAVIAAGVAVGWIGMELRGYAVVHDPGGRIVAATLDHGGGDRRPMRLLTRGYWVGLPRRDGAIELTCADGRRVPSDYVTGGMKTVVTVRAGTCRRR